MKTAIEILKEDSQNDFVKQAIAYNKDYVMQTGEEMAEEFLKKYNINL